MTKQELPDAAAEAEQARRETAAVLRGFGRERHHLIPILQQVQARLGYLPREAMQASLTTR